jgi:hypothetical protein
MSNINTERQRARAAYAWLWFSPLLTIPTFFMVVGSDPGYQLLCSGSGDCSWDAAVFLTGLLAILVSALWHLILLLQMGSAQTEFVRWHYRQALMVAGIRTAIPLGFLLFDVSIGGENILLFLAIPVLALYRCNGKSRG